jgi:hypothetical protein
MPKNFKSELLYRENYRKFEDRERGIRVSAHLVCLGFWGTVRRTRNVNLKEGQRRRAVDFPPPNLNVLALTLGSRNSEFRSSCLEFCLTWKRRRISYAWFISMQAVSYLCSFLPFPPKHFFFFLSFFFFFFTYFIKLQLI